MITPFPSVSYTQPCPEKAKTLWALTIWLAVAMRNGSAIAVTPAALLSHLALSHIAFIPISMETRPHVLTPGRPARLR
jgi:hypothetical protein